jgi:hypothetical protein
VSPRALTHGEETIMKSATFTIRGITPLICHNERLANPFDDLTKSIKAITGKRKKTEDDLLEMARLEWLGGLYFSPEAGIHMPGYNILAAIIGGGKMHKLGTAIKRAALVQEDTVPIQYEGPKDPDALFKQKAFVDMRSVKVGTSKVLRCRPIFRDWRLTFTLLYEETALQLEDIDRVLRDCGAMVGLGDYRPRFGRFEVVG